MRTLPVALVLAVLTACETHPAAHDAGRDGGLDAYAPPDVWFGDTNPSDSGACARTPSFGEVQATLSSTCATPACHSRVSPEPGGGLVLDDVDSRMRLVDEGSSYGPSVHLVIPGDVEHSFLWQKITGELGDGGTLGAPMPLGDPWMEIPADQREIVRCWIAGGAP